jgi:hypothetical protein
MASEHDSNMSVETPADKSPAATNQVAPEVMVEAVKRSRYSHFKDPEIARAAGKVSAARRNGVVPGAKSFRERLAHALAWVSTHRVDSPSSSPLIKRLQLMSQEQPVSFMNLVLKYHPPLGESGGVEAATVRRDEELLGMVDEIMKEYQGEKAS